METIYWIQRIGTISTLSSIIGILGGFVTLALFLLWVYNFDCDEDESIVGSFIRKFKGLIAMTIILLIIGIFTPTERELYAIYGIGGTLDYIKDNEAAKKLPDKVIRAIDAWVDQKLDDDKSN